MTIPPDMQTELDKFDKISEVALTDFTRKLDAETPPPMLFHYTDDMGLKGILEHGNIRLTSISNLNDPAELKHGFSHAVEIINRRAATGPGESKLFAQQFERFLIDGGIEAAAHYFVCCFSAAGDDLGQWRSYADNGRGYALGFDTSLLEDAFIKASGLPDSNNSTFHVKYSDATAVQLHTEIIDSMFHLISLPRGKKLDSPTLHEYMGDLLVLTWMHCLRSALFFKHEAYSNEAEYRFLQIHKAGPHPAPEVKYRTRPYELVRYREFDWRTASAKSLKKIIVGPAADKAKAPLFAKDCLRAFHTSEAVEIAFSTIPYRS
ncbi:MULTISPECIES: DUF2971 domain-containing protein [unclassified Bradyrhizobium]